MKRIYTRNEIEAVIVVVLLLLWLVGKIIFRNFLPEYMFRAYIAIPLLFLMFSFVITWLTSVWDRKVQAGAMTREKALNNFMLGKAVKLLVSFIIIFCYVRFAGSNGERIPFLLTFFVFYVVFTAWETFAIYSFMQRHKAVRKIYDR